MEISELRERQNLSDDKKLKKAFSNFKTLLKELNYYQLEAGRFDSAYKAAKVTHHRF